MVLLLPYDYLFDITITTIHFQLKICGILQLHPLLLQQLHLIYHEAEIKLSSQHPTFAKSIKILSNLLLIIQLHPYKHISSVIIQNIIWIVPFNDEINEVEKMSLLEIMSI